MAETAVDEYPKRPAFYAYKLTRLMFKTALANEIGPEACHMIIQIAHTEDATRYSKAVKFYNEQLMPVCGFANVKALDRARAKAIEAGWLKYIPGGKGVAGKYWTLVPEKYVNWEDGSIDESSVPEELNADHPVSLPATGKETPDKRQESDQTNGRQTPDKRATIYPSPNPEEIYIPPDSGKNADSSSGELVEQEFVPLNGFCVAPRVTALEIGGRLIEYHEFPWNWEQEFIRRWNKVDGVVIRSSGLDPPLRRKLQQRLMEGNWLWKQAFERFPITAEWFTSTQNLSWFLKPDTVSDILDGTYHQKDKPKGGKNGKQQRGADFDPNSTNPDDGKL